MVEQRASVVVVGDQVEFVLGLKGIAEAHYVWVAHLEENISLAFRMLDLTFLSD